jgi:hypothetical protein
MDMVVPIGGLQDEVPLSGQPANAHEKNISRTVQIGDQCGKLCGSVVALVQILPNIPGRKTDSVDHRATPL